MLIGLMRSSTLYRRDAGGDLAEAARERASWADIEQPMLSFNTHMRRLVAGLCKPGEGATLLGGMLSRFVLNDFWTANE